MLMIWTADIEKIDEVDVISKKNGTCRVMIKPNYLFVILIVLVTEVTPIYNVVDDRTYIDSPQATLPTESYSTDKIGFSSAIQIEEQYPMPAYVPRMRLFEYSNYNGFYLPEKPSSYITPDNEWVRYYANQLYIEYDGGIRYKNKQIPVYIDSEGRIIGWTEEPFINNYSLNVYGKNVDKNNIPWMMPDYYLTHGMTGVCTAWSATVASMMLSGEMSIKQSDGTLLKQVIPANVIVGYSGGIKDAWVEYIVYGSKFITSTSSKTDGYGELGSATSFIAEIDWRNQFIPKFEITDKYFKRV